ncbi:MAG: MarR family transcriptional regulator, partial [Candidatus Aminicenantes bacterium]|nr:MarR family transcriptional regulator [Candidatus Aminicenantes bacterium]NIM82010.1 MarR family transcriptional regulator [Candidatus Aminicenantes bacterium]NIN22340.1 MarR family transcriptional regulator [Candidatus Aminicenantes bacterium]NIN45221.1 MarR family transcriptional regulator [Candidatus Aminicenantes bacterium]NIN88041.1 MarR family transcriptional regulator [Candidatus Aminicenantes bacterium]
MNEIKDNSSKSIFGAIRRLVRLTYLDSRAMVKRYGITGPQSLVLKSLIESVEPLSSATLSRKLNVSPANITGIIDRLEEKGLVKRLKKQGDRRAIEYTQNYIDEKLSREEKTTLR